MKDLLKLIEKPNLVNFDQIRISIASPEEISSWSHGEIKKNLKLSIIELSNQREVVCSVQEFLVLSKTMNVCVENIRE